MKQLVLLFTAILLSISSDISAQTDSTMCKGDGGVVFYPQRQGGMLYLGSYTIKGLVEDASGTPLIGVSVFSPKKRDFLTVKGLSTLRGTVITDEDGRFSIDIEGVKPTNLHISYLGYGTMSIAVSPEFSSGDIVVQMAEYEYPKGGSSKGPITIGKPAIYLYPEKKTKIQIKHTFKGDIHTTYPAYNDGWEVVAEPNGKLLNTADKRHYDYLFWDGFYNFHPSHFDYKEGFYVSRENYTSFLLEKLTILGLNETEINDFIVYWLPILSMNEQSFIHFRVNDDIDNSSKLEVTPQPDVMIRVFMEFKSYDGKSPKLKEQKLPELKRGKFTLVEWGGSDISTGWIK